MIFNLIDFENKELISFKTHSITSEYHDDLHIVRIYVEREKESLIEDNLELLDLEIVFTNERDVFQFCEELHYQYENITIKFKENEVYLFGKSNKTYAIKSHALNPDGI